LFPQQYGANLADLISFSLEPFWLQSNSFANARFGKNDVATAAMALLEAFVFKQPYQVLETNIAI
jgi:hypothetical protein